MKKYIFVILACLSISFSSLIVEAAAATGEYSYDGMGRIVLEKNMVNNVNTLTQDMFYKGDPGSRVPNTNTIFVIKNDFVLAEDIIIPANCVLEFEGGSLSGNFVINLNSTTIIANNSVFDCVIKGSISNSTVEAKWIKNPNSIKLQYLLDGLQKCQTFKFDNISYNLEKNTNIPSSYTSEVYLGDQPCLQVTQDNVIIDGNNAILKVNTHAQGILEIFGAKNVIIKNLILEGYGQQVPLDRDTGVGEKGGSGSKYHTTGYWGYYKNNDADTSISLQYGYGQPWGTFGNGYIGNVGIGLLIYRGCENILVKNVSVSGFNYSGIQVGFLGDAQRNIHIECKNVTIEDCSVNSIYSNGIAIGGVNNYKVIGCTVNSIGHPDALLTDTHQDPGYGIITQGSFGINPKNGIISNNIVYSCIRKGIDLHMGSKCTISNNFIYDCLVGGIYAVGSSSTQRTEDILIEGNHINNCGRLTSSHGEGAIMVGGCNENLDTCPDTNISVIGNQIINSGSKNERIGVIWVYRGKNISILSNVIIEEKDDSDSPFTAIVTGTSNQSYGIKDVKISDNIVRGYYTWLIRPWGASDLIIKNNYFYCKRETGGSLIYSNNTVVSNVVFTGNILRVNDSYTGVSIAAGQIKNLVAYDNIINAGTSIPTNAIESNNIHKFQSIRLNNGASGTIPINPAGEMLMIYTDKWDSVAVIVAHSSASVTVLSDNNYTSDGTQALGKIFVSKTAGSNSITIKNNSGSDRVNFYYHSIFGVQL